MAKKRYFKASDGLVNSFGGVSTKFIGRQPAVRGRDLAFAQAVADFAGFAV
ncbi:MAG: hypothetical protein KGK15_05830 [Burkholderiales bacterium]|nr:hypothetical protein [Burkholderiales bacterium]MDE2611510.1 hypothetical protein [Burkholderiales bacterium]